MTVEIRVLHRGLLRGDRDGRRDRDTVGRRNGASTIAFYDRVVADGRESRWVASSSARTRLTTGGWEWCRAT